MGASNFSQVVVGKYKTADEAYRAAVAEARSQYGNDGYNGTISTTSGFKDVSKEAPIRQMSKAFDDFTRKLLDDKRFEKFGYCACIELHSSALEDAKKQARVEAGARGVKAFVFIGWAAE